MRHALAAGDVDRAAYLMELAMPAIRRDRRESLLPGWLAALPDEVIARSPVLSVFHAYLLMMAGDLDGFAARLDDAERVLAGLPDGRRAPGADTEELRTLPATIAVYRASLAQARGDVAATVRHAQHALDLAGPDDHLARGSAAGFLGLAAWARGDVTPALETFAQAVASLHAAGNIVDELSSTVVLADMWSRRVTRARPAGSTLQRLLDGEARGAPVPRATPTSTSGSASSTSRPDDLVAARAHLERAAVLGERGAMTESRYRWFVAMAQVARAEGDPQEAISAARQGGGAVPAGLLSRTCVPSLRDQGSGRIAARRPLGGRRVGAERGVVHGGQVRYLHEFDHLTLVRLVLARHGRRWTGPGRVPVVGGSAPMLDPTCAEAAEIGMLRAPDWGCGQRSGGSPRS